MKRLTNDSGYVAVWVLVSISLGVAGNSQKLGTVATASAAAFAAVFVGSLTYLLYNQFRDGEVTNILREMLPSSTHRDLARTPSRMTRLHAHT